MTIALKVSKGQFISVSQFQELLLVVLTPSIPVSVEALRAILCLESDLKTDFSQSWIYQNLRTLRRKNLAQFILIKGVKNWTISPLGQKYLEHRRYALMRLYRAVRIFDEKKSEQELMDSLNKAFEFLAV